MSTSNGMDEYEFEEHIVESYVRSSPPELSNPELTRLEKHTTVTLEEISGMSRPDLTTLNTDLPTNVSQSMSYPVKYELTQERPQANIRYHVYDLEKKTVTPGKIYDCNGISYPNRNRNTLGYSVSFLGRHLENFPLVIDLKTKKPIVGTQAFESLFGKGRASNRVAELFGIYKGKIYYSVQHKRHPTHNPVVTFDIAKNELALDTMRTIDYQRQIDRFVYGTLETETLNFVKRVDFKTKELSGGEAEVPVLKCPIHRNARRNTWTHFAGDKRHLLYKPSMICFECQRTEQTDMRVMLMRADLKGGIRSECTFRFTGGSFSTQTMYRIGKHLGMPVYLLDCEADRLHLAAVSNTRLHYFAVRYDNQQLRGNTNIIGRFKHSLIMSTFNINGGYGFTWRFCNISF